MPRETRHPGYSGGRLARVCAAALLALIVTACSSGVQRAPEAELQQPQFDEPGEQAGSLTIDLSEEARKDVVDNLKFNQDTFDQTIRRALDANNLLAEPSDDTLPGIVVTVTSVRVRSSFTAVMFGFMAGNDHIDGDVTVRGPDGGTLQQFGISAAYALGGLAGGQDSARLDWLYEEFAKRLTQELTGKTEEQVSRTEAQ